MTDQLLNDLGQPIARLVAILSGQSDSERMRAIEHMGQKLGEGLMGMDSRPDPEQRQVAITCLAAAFHRVSKRFDS